MLMNDPTTMEYQEHYVLALMRVLLADRPDFELTTGPTALYGNTIRGIRTTDIYALLVSTPAQQALARAVVEAEIERRRLWWEHERAAELAARLTRGYPY